MNRNSKWCHCNVFSKDNKLKRRLSLFKRV